MRVPGRRRLAVFTTVAAVAAVAMLITSVGVPKTSSFTWPAGPSAVESLG